MPQLVKVKVPVASIEAMKDRRFKGLDKASDPKFMCISSDEVKWVTLYPK
ncbi:hypothetical protein [Arthrobacter sp. NIO-1057]|nr:hypothetical protein [Arthrobacter sp. NIO-1057]